MFGNKKRFEEMNKEIASLKDRVEVLEFEKKNPSGLEITTSGTYELMGVGDTILKYIKNGKVKEFTLEKALMFINSAWRLDGNTIINDITEREGLAFGMMPKYKTITKKYKFDIQNERLVELCVTPKTEEPNFEKIAEDTVKTDIIECLTTDKKSKKNNKGRTKIKRPSGFNVRSYLLENVEDIKKLKAKGWSNGQIAEKYKVGKTSVWEMLNGGKNTVKPKIKKTKTQTLKDNIEDIMNMLNSGNTYKEVAEKYNTQAPLVCKIIKEAKKENNSKNIIAELEKDSIDYKKERKFGRQYV